MGTYNYTKEMLIEEFKDFLDDFEGDFTTNDLVEALEFMKLYPHTSDCNSKAIEKMFYKRLKGVRN